MIEEMKITVLTCTKCGFEKRETGNGMCAKCGEIKFNKSVKTLQEIEKEAFDSIFIAKAKLFCLGRRLEDLKKFFE